MRVTVLASGSRGNATLIESAGKGVLVDAGFAPRTLRRRMRSVLGFVPARLDGVVITHAHGDHSAYAEAAAASFDAPLFLTSPTRRRLGLRSEPHCYGPNMPIELGKLVIRALALPHDSPQVGLLVEDGFERLAVATDLGRVPPGLLAELEGCETLLVESNHNPELLASGRYPPFLKARVASDQGHLSNGQTAALLAELGPALRTVVLMHLSESNNRPEFALAAARGALRQRTRVLAAHQTNPLVLETALSAPSSQLELGF